MKYLVRKHKNIISQEVRDKVSKRKKVITKSLNLEFWESSSDITNSFYVGSYGRKTAISTSDIDLFMVIPNEERERFTSRLGNGPSRFLQVVRKSLKNSYPLSDIRADGQVVKINFSDGIKFEVIPVFENDGISRTLYGEYTYPDSNAGGKWLSASPKSEIKAMKIKNEISNGLFNATCKHLRYIRDTYFKSYSLSGITIDAFVYHAMGNWKYVDNGTSTSRAGSYELHLLSYFVNNYRIGIYTLSIPGSNERIEFSRDVECLKKVLYKITEGLE